MPDSKNDIAWKLLFDKHKIVKRVSEDNCALIDSAQINVFREARLMTKFDHRSQLPALFADNGLSILPVSRGGYVIGRFETFHDFDRDDVEIVRIDFPSFLTSLDYNDITSEATAINCAFVSKILSDFVGEEILYPTVSGRMSSLSFNFNIKSHSGDFKIAVGNSQVEIDGGYEGDNSLTLIEAKNYLSNDFLVRQLYYPYRLWSNKISKPVKSVFLTYTNGVFHLREYAFDDINHYNSVRLIRQKKYSIQESTINLEIIRRLLSESKPQPEPEIPFPQADSFERVINLCELLFEKSFLSKDEITNNYDFDARQTDYYINAGRYLGLIALAKENEQTGCVLTEAGKRIFNMNIVTRQIEFVKAILSHTAFARSLALHFEKGRMPSKNEIVEIMKISNLYKVGTDTTYLRRASTVLGWIIWILKLVNT